MSDLPEVYIYMLCSMGGFATGDYSCRKHLTADYLSKEYNFGSKAILFGRTTWESDLPGPIDLSKFKDSKVERVDYVAPKKDDYYIIAIDSKGKLKWTSGYFCILAEYGRTQKAQVITIIN